MVRLLTLIHRWLGILFCLLFAMWFATGMVMHFVPFPTLTEAERIDGLAVVDGSQVAHGPGDAVRASQIDGVTSVRLLQRADGPVYVVSGVSSLAALDAATLSSAAVRSDRLAVAIATDHARRRGLDVVRASFVEVATHDQWTVPNGLDPHRPLYRIALNDAPGTELYVSSATGEVVRDTSRTERLWNYVGSVAHWIYPTVLRRNWAAWDWAVWGLSLIAMIAALSGALLGVIRVKVINSKLSSPFKGWHAWHHWLGMASTAFLMTWIFSGWLSMDHGRIFSTGKIGRPEARAITGEPDWAGHLAQIPRPPEQYKEIEWFAFGGRIFRRTRKGLAVQRMLTDSEPVGELRVHRSFLQSREVTAAIGRLGVACDATVPVSRNDDYPLPASMPDAPVYRSVCGDIWYHVDGASGAILERIDSSRRAYRWLYGALHTLDFPFLGRRPRLRTGLILILCSCGFIFSLTGVMLAWRRLRLMT